ncbi:MAG: hypothetical protein Harvfovirus2_67 [Harvfovirus sp.]|uniref:Uncharacterized protein n=1 Tax=Harvfovirus sp. TaxID=2487768 RepID=A0A3G5A034_9VIRU|nr:MAG: hypothetical protein Harvfovirus2_67 [Harvfovirus sp.]
MAAVEEKHETFEEYFKSVLMGPCDYDLARKNSYIDRCVTWIKDKEIEGIARHKLQWKKYADAWLKMNEGIFSKIPIFAAVVLFIGTLPFELMVDDAKLSREELEL